MLFIIRQWLYIMEKDCVVPQVLKAICLHKLLWFISQYTALRLVMGSGHVAIHRYCIKDTNECH